MDQKSANDVISLLKNSLGIRESLRLLACADIVSIFKVYGEFSRSEVVRELGEAYTLKTLDRAIADLEAGGVLSVVQVVKNDISAGSTYHITEASKWMERSAYLVNERRMRHGRGGCRSSTFSGL